MTDASPDQRGREHDAPLSRKTIWWSAAVLLVAGVGVAVWLLIAYGGGGEAERNQLEAIKTAGAIVVGTGGAAALLLAARRQRTAEQDLIEKRRDLGLREQAQRHAELIAADNHAHQTRVADDDRLDAAHRRITELYTRAAELLGSDQAPVRLAGLYALERVAQDNEAQRQTIVNVWCAYLRMPYLRPAAPPADGTDEASWTRDRDWLQERQVRLAAQRLLADHLRSDDPDNPTSTFWRDINLDLTGATLVDFNLNGCAVHTARFDKAQFSGDAGFEKVRFSGDAGFGGARFSGYVWFDGARFGDYARFDEARFGGDAVFNRVRFDGDAGFNRVRFDGDARFNQVRFGGDAGFNGAQFDGYAGFIGVRFGGDAVFEGAQFVRGVPEAVDRVRADDPPGDEANGHISR